MYTSNFQLIDEMQKLASELRELAHSTDLTAQSDKVASNVQADIGSAYVSGIMEGFGLGRDSDA